MSELQMGLKLRKEMLQKLKSEVRLYLGDESASLQRYAAPYKKDIERARWQMTSFSDLVEKLRQSDIVFGGDFHAFSQSQRSHLRLLRQVSQNHKIILAVECVPSSKQRILDQYISGSLSEADFIKKTEWYKNWGFPWQQYKPLFEWVKSQGGRCIALNLIRKSRSYKGLIERDVHAAQVLVKNLKVKKNDEILYVLFGDLHIAKDHLPRRVQRQLPQVKVTNVFLNPEKIYFQLYKKNVDHSSVVIKFNKNEFCLLESPPWVKWQSYLMYLNQNYDQFIDDDGTMNFSEHVDSLVQMISSDLEFKVQESVRVESFSDLDFMEIQKDKLSRNLFQRMHLSVANDLNFYFPHKKIGFLARGTVNYSAHLAGLIVHGLVSSKKNWEMPSQKTFEVLIWQETVAFFLSKLVNPNRKAVSMEDLKKQLQAFSPQDKGEDSLRLALDQKMKDLIFVYSLKKEQPVKARDSYPPLTYLRAAKLLGAMMGDKLFLGYKTRLLSKVQIRELLTYDTEKKNFHDFYIHILKTVDKIDMEAKPQVVDEI